MKKTSIGIEYTRIPPAFEGGEGQRSLKTHRQQRTSQRRAGESLAQQAIARRGWSQTHRLERRNDHWQAVAAKSYAPLWLSISHSGPWAICAHDSTAACGVDIECVTRDIDVEYACTHFMHASTGEAIAGLPTSHETRVFLMLWTLLEAQGKILGTALPQTLYRQIVYNDLLQAHAWSNLPYAFFGRWLDSSHFGALICLRSHTHALNSLGWKRLDNITLLHDMAVLQSIEALPDMTSPAEPTFAPLPRPERG